MAPYTDDALTDLRNEIEQLRKEVQAQTQKSAEERRWDVLGKIAVSVTSAALIGVVVWALNLESRVTKIESNRITAGDFNTAITQLRSEMAKGPDWLRDAVIKIAATQDLLRGDVGKLSERVIRLETKIEK